MESVVCQRIKAYLGDNKISIASFAKEIGMSQTTVNRQVSGGQALSSKVVEEFLRTFPDVSAEWLMRGRGEMFVDSDGQEKSLPSSTNIETDIWRIRYEELDKRYGQLLTRINLEK